MKKNYKVFVQAEHLERLNDKGRPEEKMFSYDMEDESYEAAFARGKARFDLEQAAKGWKAIGTSVLEM